MKRPTWATVVGILGIIFGLFGLMNSAQLMVMPKMVDFQRDMITNMQKNLPQRPKNAPNPKITEDFFNKFFGQRAEWFNTASLVLGIVGIAVNGLYLFAGISLLNMKKYAVSLFYTALVLSLVFGVTRAFIVASAYSSSFMGTAMIVPGLMGAVIDVILLLVVLTSDKTDFRKAAAPPPVPST
jgi:hypothetical protein